LQTLNLAGNQFTVFFHITDNCAIISERHLQFDPPMVDIGHITTIGEHDIIDNAYIIQQSIKWWSTIIMALAKSIIIT
jgi:hypothetical protein